MQNLLSFSLKPLKNKSLTSFLKPKTGLNYEVNNSKNFLTKKLQISHPEIKKKDCQVKVRFLADRRIKEHPPPMLFTTP